MSETRLFIGDLSCNLQEETLENEIKSYCDLVKLDIKEKKDIVTGEVLKRFAFATLCAPSNIVDQCIQGLNGKRLDGSAITVQRAQESFMERLKREREEKNQIPDTSQKEEFNPDNFNFNFNNQSNDNYRNDYTYQRNNPAREYVRNEPAKEYQHNTEQKTDPVLPALKSFSGSVWADSESEHEEDNQGDSGSQYIESTEVPTYVKSKTVRFDPTKTSSGKQECSTTESSLVPARTSIIAHGLSFTGASSQFSLLSMFDQGQTEENEAMETEEPQSPTVVEPVETSAEQPVKPQQTRQKLYVKSYKFFVDRADPEVEENLRWLYTEMDEATKKQFRNDQKEIIKYHNDRFREAKRQKREKMLSSGKLPLDAQETESWNYTEALKLPSDIHLPLLQYDDFRTKTNVSLSQSKYKRKGKDGSKNSPKGKGRPVSSTTKANRSSGPRNKRAGFKKHK